MFGTSTTSQVRPVQLGTTVNNSVYGSVIPVCYGRTKGALYLIWAADQHKSGTSSQGGKGKKSSQPTYAEHVDFLIGHNPIAGVLEMWQNNQPLPLNTLSYVGGVNTGVASVTIPDSNFYSVLGVTLTIPYSVVFNDYGGQGRVILSGTYEMPLWNAAYAGPDPVNGSSDRYSPFYCLWTPGSGPTVYFPQNFGGADGLNGALKIYYAGVNANAVAPNNKGVAAHIPAHALRLTFEPQLGCGPEFQGVDNVSKIALNTEQILYPHYAGLGSANLDLGTGTSLPNIQAEILGTYPLYSTGDADFADMIEDIIRMGISQAGLATAYDSAYTDAAANMLIGIDFSPLSLAATGTLPAYTMIQRGIGAFTWPGATQCITFGNTGAKANTVPIAYNRVNTAGNMLVVAHHLGNATASSVHTVSDTLANGYTPIFSATAAANTAQLWWALPAAGANAVTVTPMMPHWQTTVLEIGGVDTFDASTSDHSGTATSLSITTAQTDNSPAYILAFASYLAAGTGTDATIVARPTVLLNGWGNNAHVGAYEEGVDLAYGWGLNNDTTYPYVNPGNAVDGDATTYASCSYLHTHQYAGCVWTFGAGSVSVTNPLGSAYITLWTEPNGVATQVASLGTTTYSYIVQAVDGSGNSLAVSPVITTHLGPATIVRDNYVGVGWSAVSGAAGYRVYRTYGGTTGIIAPAAQYDSIQGKSTLTTVYFNDTGYVADSSPAIPTAGASSTTTVTSSSSTTTLSASQTGILSVLSSVPDSGPGTDRSAGIWYSLDGGTTWTAFYDTGIRAEILDSVTLPAGQNLSQVQVMAFLDAHDDMTHWVYDIYVSVGGTPGVQGTAPLQPPVVHWDTIVDQRLGSGDFLIQSRTVYHPGTFTWTPPLGTSNNLPLQIALVSFKCKQTPLYPKPLGNILDQPSLELCRTQCRANGLTGSLLMDSQQAASDWLKDIYQAMNAAPVWSGFTLKSIPYSEVSTCGNGATYTAPTASGPIANFTASDFLGDTTTPLIVVKRAARVDVPNILQMQFPNRDGDYNDVVISQPETGSIALYAPRKEDPQQLRCVQTTIVARMLLGIAVRRQNYIRNTYQFRLNAKWKLLEPMDLVTLTDPQIGLSALPVRLTKIEEDEDFQLSCEAESFIYGCHAPDTTVAVTTTSPYQGASSSSPGSVNTPIFLEPVLRLSSTPQLWMLVSGPNSTFGGSLVYLSTDGGTSYDSVGITAGNAITGVTVNAWSASVDPDTTNNLQVNLTESLGTLSSYQVANEDNFADPCYVSGGAGTIPYELMSYAVATLTAAHQYTLMATGGNHLRRSAFGAPTAGAGVAHAAGSRFGFLGSTTVAPGVLKIALDSRWVGVTLYFKFLAFNQQGGAVESLSEVEAYPYTPTGVANALNAYALTPSVVLSQPSATQITMVQASVTFSSNTVNYNARTLTIPDPGGTPTWYYVTIGDSAYLGDTGTTANLTAYAETTTAKVGVPGYTYMGSLQAIHAGSGTALPGGWPTSQPARWM